MQCYKLFPSPDTFGFALSTGKNDPANRDPSNQSHYYLGCEFTEGWQFTKQTQQDLKRLYLLINPVEAKEMPDFWGNFSPVVFKNDNGGPVAVSPKIHSILTELMPGRFETLPAGPVIDRTHGREIVNHGHVFVTFTEERDTIDRDQNRIVRQTRYGTDIWYTSVPTTPVIDATKIGDGVIWREALNGELLVSDLFKNAFENAGGQGLNFYPLKLSNT